MESPQKNRGSDDGSSGYGYGRRGSAYGYGGYPGYGYGYGYGGSAETSVQRTLQDYVLILRERIWYVVMAFLVVFASVLIFTYTKTPIYQSTATVQIFRREAMVMQVQQVMDNEVNSAEDLNTQVNILKSSTIVQHVAERLAGEDLRRFLAPYERPGRPPPSVEGILQTNRDVVPQRLSLIIAIEYNHPDKEIAAKVANLFADEYIAYNAHVQADESIKAVEELSDRADEQRKKVEDIANALQTYREKNHMVSLDQRKDIVTDNLKSFNNYVTQGSNALQEAETRWKQMLACRQRGDSLLDLPFIASVPIVAQLQQQVAAQKITVAQLSERYRAKHPVMIEAVNSLNEAQLQLQHAIDTSAAQVETEYQTALQNYTKAQQALASQEADSLNLDHFAVDYSNLERDYDVNEKLLEQILGRMHETSVSGTIENQSGRIVDRAAPGSRPISPNFRLNLGLGAVGGLGLGLALAFFVAYIDDRVKSALDIEAVVGLSLIGIIPEIKRLGEAENMQDAVSKGTDREASEAFATLYSGLQLKDESKKAQCILITSTVAGEGKTFIATHLATTFAEHEQRVVLIDCDLRRPAVHRVFHLENLAGVIDVCTGEKSLDDVIVKNVQPNLDVITTGGRSKNPTQNLNSKAFAVMLSELRKRYDRIFVDTPPVAIVSDALVVLPLVDGSLYSLYFNKVRRKTAQFAAQRLLEANVPNLGAILNGLSGGVGGYYYSHYYDKSYKAYYVDREEKGLKG
jgi:capsular exopolysaccharide synthesis family protein